MDIQKFKPLVEADQFKGLDKNYSSLKEAYGDGEGADENLTWYLIDRNNSNWNTDDLKNLFMSFGLAREGDADEQDLLKSFGAIDWYKGKTMLIAEIPQSGCGSFIDGSTIKLRVPTGTSSGDYVTFYGSSFKGYRDAATGYQVSATHDDSVYGCASIYLFPNTYGANSWSDDNHGEHPYTGTIDGAINPNAGLASWTSANIESKTFYPHLQATQWIRNPDDGLDMPYGVALLEKGIFVIFDMPGTMRTDFLGTEITGETANHAGGIFSADTANFYASTVTGGTSEPNTNPANARAIRFTGTSGQANARVSYRTIDEDYKLIYFCHAGQAEFNSTSNHTYDHRKAFFRPEEADDVYVTEIALYDDSNQVMAYAKLSEPVSKNELETLTFKVELNIGSD